MPPSSTAQAQAQASIQRSAPVIAGGVAGASLIALLAVSSVVAPALAGGATLATVLAWLSGLGSNALAGWLTEWAVSQLARFDGDDPDREQHVLEQLARDLTLQLQSNADLATAAELLIVQTDAVAVALDALTGQADTQGRLLRTLLEDLQQATFRNERLHEATLQTVATSTRQLLAAQGQGQAHLKKQLDTLLATVERMEATMRQSPPAGGVAVAGDAGVVQVTNISGGNVGSIVGQQFNYVMPPRGGEPVRLADALARLQALPRTDIPALAPLPPGSHMPLRRNPLFVGREADLRALACALADGATVAIGQIAAATGLGGIGKTNLASEFVHRYGQFFAGGVYWISFGDTAAIPAEVASCGAAGLVDRPDWAALRPDDQVRQVRAAWAEPIPRLLVFDNCDDTDEVSAEALLTAWCPTSGGAVVLITSRRGVWDAGLGVTPCALGVLAREESIDLLRRLQSALTDADADAIAATVGDLPLALHLSGNYLKEYRSVRPDTYLRELETALLAHPALEGRGARHSPTHPKRPPTQHERHVAKTFAMSYNRLTRDNPTDTAAQALLARAACFAPGEPIPRTILLATLTQDGGDDLLAEDGLYRLVALGLLAEQPGGTVTLHRLLAAFVGQLVHDADAAAATETVLLTTLLAEGTWPQLLRAAGREIEVHLRHTAAAALPRGDQAAINLGQHFGDYLQANYAHSEAIQWYERVLPLIRQVGERIGEANVLQRIGDVQQFRKEMDGALASYAAALTLFRQVGERIGEANVLQRIGDVQQFRDDYDAALANYENGLSLFRQVGERIGEANVLQRIGDVQQFRKEMDGALASYAAALTLFRHIGARVGEAYVLRGIGAVQQFRKEMDGALASYTAALTLSRQVGDRLGEAYVLQRIGAVQQFRDDHDAALTNYENALTLFRQVGDRLGEANALKAIGDVQQFRDDYDTALANYAAALTLFRQVGARLGEANVQKAIGDVQQFQDDYDAARATYTAALTLFRQVGDRFGEANCLAAQGQLRLIEGAQAESNLLRQEAIALYHAIGDGWSIAEMTANYGWALDRINQPAQARVFFAQAADLFADMGVEDRVQKYRQLAADA